MKKKIALLLCALLLCLALSGCSLLSLLTLILSNSDTDISVLPVETAIATRAPETEATQAPTEITQVEDPVILLKHYEKSYIPVTYSDGSKGESTVDHSIRIPMFTSDSDDAALINDEIYSRCMTAIEGLEANQEEDCIYRYNYQTRQYGNIVGLVMDYTIGIQSSEFYSEYIFYFFDQSQGKLLSYEEYLQAIGLTQEAALDAIQAAGIVDEAAFPDWTLELLIADEHGTVLVISSDMIMNGTMLIESNYPIVK